MKPNTLRIGIKKLLFASLIGISIVYYIFLTQESIYQIVTDEYLFLGIALCLYVIFIYYKVKLKNLTLISYIPNLNDVDVKTTFIFFVIFQIVDFYFEDGFIGMISQWFVYWVFALIAWLITNNINFYKNFKFYKYESMSNKRL